MCLVRSPVFATAVRVERGRGEYHVAYLHAANRRPLHALHRSVARPWGGFYVAAFTEYALGYTPAGMPNAVAGGGRLGADVQVSDGFVIGALVDGALTDARGSAAVSATTTNSYRVRSLAAADLRIGVPFDWLMAYGVAGWTKAGIEARRDVNGVTSSPRFESAGYNVGAGVEYRFTTALGAFAEYRWNQLGNGHGARVGEIKSGVSLHF